MAEPEWIDIKVKESFDARWEMVAGKAKVLDAVAKTARMALVNIFEVMLGLMEGV